jgi:hypothetical protein
MKQITINNDLDGVISEKNERNPKAPSLENEELGDEPEVDTKESQLIPVMPRTNSTQDQRNQVEFGSTTDLPVTPDAASPPPTTRLIASIYKEASSAGRQSTESVKAKWIKTPAIKCRRNIKLSPQTCDQNDYMPQIQVKATTNNHSRIKMNRPVALIKHSETTTPSLVRQ